MWSVECGVWSEVCKMYSVGWRVESVECGVWSVESECRVWSGMRCVKCGVWGVKCGG